MLSDDELEQFMTRGFLRLDGAIPREVALACQDVLWERLGAQGVLRHDRATWRRPVVRLDCPWGGPFVDAGTAPRLLEAYEALLAPHPWVRLPGLGGTVPVRFPSAEDPGDAGWHIDGSYAGEGGWWVNVHSRERGLLALPLLTDVGERDAPTRLLVGSHLDVPALLAPAGEAGLYFADVRLPPATLEREVAHATGPAGTVYVCHPFLVHAATWPHRGTEARMMAQPGVATRAPFALTGEDACPVERAILRGLGR